MAYVISVNVSLHEHEGRSITDNRRLQSWLTQVAIVYAMMLQETIPSA